MTRYRPILKDTAVAFSLHIQFYSTLTTTSNLRKHTCSYIRVRFEDGVTGV